MDITSYNRVLSIQPYFVLDTKGFCQHVESSSSVSHFFGFKNDSESDIVIPIVEDSCTNVIFSYEGSSCHAHVLGASEKELQFRIEKDSDFFGVRFQPGVNPLFGEVSPKEILDKDYSLTDFIGTSELMERMAPLQDFEMRRKVFSECMADYCRKSRQSCKAGSSGGKMLELFFQIEAIIVRKRGMVKVSELEELSGYTSRYLNKVFDSAVGMSTKQFCTTVKLHFLIHEMNALGFDNLSRLSLDYNFYDQSHFIHEFKNFCRKTPLEYVEEVRKKKYEQSILTV